MAAPAGERVVYLNGKFVPESQATVSISDHGFTHGDAAFDTMRTFKGKVFKLKEHVERLYRSCKYAGIDPGISQGEMSRLTDEVVERNKHLLGPSDDFWVTQRVTRGVPSARPGEKEQPTIIILCRPLPWERAKFYQTGISMRTSPIRRTPPQYLDPRAKLQNYLNQVMAEMLAKQGDPDVWSLLLDENGNVAEGSGYNFFIVRDGRVITSHERYVLGGISRQTTMEICQELNIPAAEMDFNLYDVYTADEAFITATSVCLLPVRSVDTRTIGDGAIPGSITGRILGTWSGMVGVDIAGQYLAHIKSA
ncbi:MAG: aminotransferase class IV [Chloroflexi bacterium]|nr:aminotransferase class IV [Chloroflexota bacterium]